MLTVAQHSGLNINVKLRLLPDNEIYTFNLNKVRLTFVVDAG